jgi:hypothetical protein
VVIPLAVANTIESAGLGVIGEGKVEVSGEGCIAPDGATGFGSKGA